MSDESNKSEADDSGPVAGEVLARARRAREISIQEIAKDLHLDEFKVRALEQNRFDALGAPVFAKGYLRKYAELVGVPVDDIVADYYRLNRSVGAPPLVTKRSDPMRDPSPVPWLALLALVLLGGVAVVWWFASRSENSDGQSAAPSGSVRPADDEVELPAGPDLAEAGDTNSPTLAADVADEEQSAAESAESSRTLDEPAPAATGGSQQAAAGEFALRLVFSGDCWTEVTDTAGSRLYFGLGTAGNEVSVAGEPPLNVLLGDSGNVAVFVNGVAYPIPPSARRGQTARLTLTPP